MSKPMFGVWLHGDSADASLETGWCGDGRMNRYATSSLDDAEAYARDLLKRNPTCRYEAQPFPPRFASNLSSPDREPETYGEISFPSRESIEALRKSLDERAFGCELRRLYPDHNAAPSMHLKAGEAASYRMGDGDAPVYPTRPTEWRRLLESKIAEFERDGLIVSLPEKYKLEIVEPYATSKEALARALFATDERIEAFVAVKAERPEDRMRVMRIAWERDELGARTQAEARAKKMVASGELAPMLVGTQPEADAEMAKAILPSNMTKVAK